MGWGQGAAGMICKGLGRTRAWWLGIFPGLAIMLTVLSINFLGDALRHVLDVRESRGGSRYCVNSTCAVCKTFAAGAEYTGN